MSLPLYLVLPFAAGWARWGQVWAIAFYPYLRKTGKGSFHQENLRQPQDLLLGSMFAINLQWLVVHCFRSVLAADRNYHFGEHGDRFNNRILV